MYVDSHCHLCFPGLAEREAEVVRAFDAAGVQAALNVCTTLEEFDAVHAVAARHPQIVCSAGVHPDYTECEEPTVDRLVELAARDKVVAIGETGLDYYRLKEPLEWQRERFRVHIRAARACGKPLIVHTRSASDDTLRIMREEGARAVGGVMHCFTESLAVAEAALDLGFYISFSGIVTFKSAVELQQVAAAVPLDRLLIETDAPYLAPVPHRGKTNEPAFVPHVAAKIAALRGLDATQVGRETTANFIRLFKVLSPKARPTDELVSSLSIGA